MGLTEWRQSYLNEQMAKASFEKVIEEVRGNLEEMKADSASVAEDLIVMREWVRKKVLKEEAGPWAVGFNYSFLSNSAFEVAKANQSMSFLSLEKVQSVSEIYATQEFYAEKGSLVFDIMGEIQGNINRPDSQEFFSIVQRYRFHMGLIFNTMKAYITEGESFLELYDTQIQ